MATKYRIVPDLCTSCELCVPECPLEAISGTPPSISPDVCNGCGACAPACPAGAIESFESAPPGPAKSNGLSLSLGLKVQ